MFHEVKPHPQVPQTIGGKTWRQRHPELHKTAKRAGSVGLTAAAGLYINKPHTKGGLSPMKGKLIRTGVVVAAPSLGAVGYRKLKKSRGRKRR